MQVRAIGSCKPTGTVVSIVPMTRSSSVLYGVDMVKEEGYRRAEGWVEITIGEYENDSEAKKTFKTGLLISKSAP